MRRGAVAFDRYMYGVGMCLYVLRRLEQANGDFRGLLTDFII